MMKKIKILHCLCIVFCFGLIFSSGLSLAEEQQSSSCVDSCKSQRAACYNVNADKRICEVQYQECAAACDTKGNTDSPADAKQTSGSAENEKNVR